MIESGPKFFRHELARRAARGCLTAAAMLFGFVVLGAVGAYLLLSRVPKSYPNAAHPIPPAAADHKLGGGLDGFDSPYLGHTGSWDGQGGSMGGGSKASDLDKEAAMGLRWTFMPVYWRELEPDGPVDPSSNAPPAWLELDGFVKAAHDRRLNIFMQAPVVGGNAAGPPRWAGRREPGKSAPAKMDALADFAGKLAERYRPDGVLARREGWGKSYGVRAWEMDNEPEGYLTAWKGQPGDYAEFVTLAAQKIRAVDPEAVIAAPALAAGDGGSAWFAAALDPSANRGSPTFRAAGRPYSIGAAATVISFHDYEGLDSALGAGRTIGTVFENIKKAVEQSNGRTPGLAYGNKEDYWHTEGNFDFFGILGSKRRAAWRFQFFTRAFAAGLRKVCVMDASPAEQKAVAAYVKALPRPWPMSPAGTELRLRAGHAVAFLHLDDSAASAGRVWVIWAEAGTERADVEIPTVRSTIEIISVDGRSETRASPNHSAKIDLDGDAKMAPPVLVIDRDAAPAN